MELEIYQDVDELIYALAEMLQEVAGKSIAESGEFNFVLSGGGSPKKLYKLLASESFRNRIDWAKTYFFFGDERFVPEEDSDRNSLMAKKTMFDALHIQESHIFKVDTSCPPEESARKYAAAISGHFGEKPVQFDFNLLGLGDNAHTASLFPHTDVIEETEPTVKSVFVEELNTYRITMTAPLINQSKHIVFLVFGKNKADAVYHVLKDKKGSAQEYPARLIDSDAKKVHWFLDTSASSLL